MLKVKISDIVNSTETLQKLAQKDFKAKLAWQIARLLKQAEAEVQEFNTTRMTLINKYGDKDEAGQLITDERGNCKISPENMELFSTELNDLIQNEIELNANPLKISDLEELDFTPSDMAMLEPFIDMEE